MIKINNLIKLINSIENGYGLNTNSYGVDRFGTLGHDFDNAVSFIPGFSPISKHMPVNALTDELIDGHYINAINNLINNRGENNDYTHNTSVADIYLDNNTYANLTRSNINKSAEQKSIVNKLNKRNVAEEVNKTDYIKEQKIIEQKNYNKEKSYIQERNLIEYEIVNKGIINNNLMEVIHNIIAKSAGSIMRQADEISNITYEGLINPLLKHGNNDYLFNNSEPYKAFIGSDVNEYLLANSQIGNLAHSQIDNMAHSQIDNMAHSYGSNMANDRHLISSDRFSMGVLYNADNLADSYIMGNNDIWGTNDSHLMGNNDIWGTNDSHLMGNNDIWGINDNKIGNMAHSYSNTVMPNVIYNIATGGVSKQISAITSSDLINTMLPNEFIDDSIITAKISKKLDSDAKIYDNHTKQSVNNLGQLPNDVRILHNSKLNTKSKDNYEYLHNIWDEVIHNAVNTVDKCIDYKKPLKNTLKNMDIPSNIDILDIIANDENGNKRNNNFDGYIGAIADIFKPFEDNEDNFVDNCGYGYNYSPLIHNLEHFPKSYSSLQKNYSHIRDSIDNHNTTNSSNSSFNINMGGITQNISGNNGEDVMNQLINSLRQGLTSQGAVTYL